MIKEYVYCVLSHSLSDIDEIIQSFVSNVSSAIGSTPRSFIFPPSLTLPPFVEYLRRGEKKKVEGERRGGSGGREIKRRRRN